MKPARTSHAMRDSEHGAPGELCLRICSNHMAEKYGELCLASHPSDSGSAGGGTFASLALADVLTRQGSGWFWPWQKQSHPRPVRRRSCKDTCTTPHVGLGWVKTWCQSAFTSFWLSDGLRARPGFCDNASMCLFSRSWSFLVPAASGLAAGTFAPDWAHALHSIPRRCSSRIPKDSET